MSGWELEAAYWWHVVGGCNEPISRYAAELSMARIQEYVAQSPNWIGDAWASSPGIFNLALHPIQEC